MITETGTGNLILRPSASHGATSKDDDRPPWRVREADAVSIVNNVHRGKVFHFALTESKARKSLETAEFHRLARVVNLVPLQTSR